MRKVGCLLLSSLLCLSLVSMKAHAEGAVPELFGVREVVVGLTQFDDPKASDICGLSREQIASAFARSFAGSTVPAIPEQEARPPVMGIFRIKLIPMISTYADANLNCASWISLSAENRISGAIPPLGILRTVTSVYWRYHIKVSTSQSMHAQRVTETIQKLADKFALQYRQDQPPELLQ